MKYMRNGLENVTWENLETLYSKTVQFVQNDASLSYLYASPSYFRIHTSF